MLLLAFPAEPFVPKHLHNELTVGTFVCWTGSIDEGERVLAPIREIAGPVVGLVGPVPYV